MNVKNLILKNISRHKNCHFAILSNTDKHKSPGVKSLCVNAFALECRIHIQMIWKFMEQNFLFPKGLNWVQ